MSGVAAVAGGADRVGAGALVRRMLHAMPGRGRGALRVLDCAGRSPLALGAVRHEWEAGPQSAGSATDGTLCVVADATLYYRDDLVQRAGARPAAEGTRPSDLPAAELILAAWRAKGVGTLALLEGDYACIVWDAEHSRLVAARDFSGKRSLFYAWHNGTLRVASTASGILADPALPRDADLATLAAVASGLWAHAPDTGYRHIRELPAGHLLTWEPGAAPRVQEFWRPPDTIQTRRQPLDAAAEQLRALLTDAVRERLAPSGPTAVTLSGGWDSSAVYAVAQSVLPETGAEPRALHPVSISYPEGDPGREDELIRDIVERWGQQPDFIDVDTIPLFSDAEARARHRDQPFAHAYEEWNRRLSRRARAAGARVILDGVGGDQLFQTTDVYLADLFRTGQWPELARQFRIRSGGSGSVRGFYRWAVRPALPDALVRAISTVRRLPPPVHYLDRGPPFWIHRKFLDAHHVIERDAAARPALPRKSSVLAETHAYLRFPFYPRIFGLLHEFALDEGVELRSPLLDDRVVRFAVQRPWSERADGAETKVLLRRAMRGLLPDHVIAPRAHRTGVTSAYFLRQMRAHGWEIAQRVLPDSRLAALGMIDAAAFRRAWEHILQHDNDELAARAFFTLQAELWIRERELG